MTHTKGPWIVEYNDYRNEYDVYPIKDGPPKFGRWAEICTTDANIYDEAEANARLIASAPELLEALEEVIKWYAARDINDDFLPIHIQREEIINAIQAVSKAKGEL